MNKSTIRSVFFKHYTPDDLYTGLASSFEELSQTIYDRKVTEKPERPDDIIETIFKARSRLRILVGITNNKTAIVVPVHYLEWVDFVRNAVVETCSYLASVYETTDPWFKERFAVEDLEEIGKEVSSKIKSTGLEISTRSLHTEEIKIYFEFFAFALIALMGEQNFREIFAKEFNESLNVIRECYKMAKILNKIDPDTTPS